ncbi:hypothetical protein TorRG33x02_285910 [Trema orientale]|uniref:DNA helicase n=1 Tax=Trema orientale TaxID=63057 RepID=A0A2P5CGD8_TREOI|nr:hypothetical protein TorRG33x02_285910 [Trema orientale]
MESHLQVYEGPRFDQAKHRVLCSELKQLYVAITRTRRRLWIFENGGSDGFSNPIYDYWHKLQIVQVRMLTYSFLKEVQVQSSKEEWKSRGTKLFSETAKICFQRAGETSLEQWAEAAGLRAAAWSASNLNFDMAEMRLNKAAKIFKSLLVSLRKLHNASTSQRIMKWQVFYLLHSIAR